MSKSTGGNTVTDPLSEPLLPLHHDPHCYVAPDNMKTWSLSAWCAGLENHQSEYQKWNVTKIEHMKSFHFSSVFHEYLRVTVKRQDKHGEASEPVVIFVERMAEQDEVTAGWAKVEHPKLHSWWIIRLLKGYYGDGRHLSSSVNNWRAVGYSAPDYLRHLEFTKPVSLSSFAKLAEKISLSQPTYNAIRTNCYWFAYSVYEAMVSESSSNHDGGYSKHIGKFANITFGISKPIIDPLVKIIDLAHEKAGGGRRGDGA